MTFKPLSEDNFGQRPDIDKGGMIRHRLGDVLLDVALSATSPPAMSPSTKSNRERENARAYKSRNKASRAAKGTPTLARRSKSTENRPPIEPGMWRYAVLDSRSVMRERYGVPGGLIAGVGTLCRIHETCGMTGVNAK